MTWVSSSTIGSKNGSSSRSVTVSVSSSFFEQVVHIRLTTLSLFCLNVILVRACSQLRHPFCSQSIRALSWDITQGRMILWLYCSSLASCLPIEYSCSIPDFFEPNFKARPYLTWVIEAAGIFVHDTSFQSLEFREPIKVEVFLFFNGMSYWRTRAGLSS